MIEKKGPANPASMGEYTPTLDNFPS
jgi:hypothetical protein